MNMEVNSIEAPAGSIGLMAQMLSRADWGVLRSSRLPVIQRSYSRESNVILGGRTEYGSLDMADLWFLGGAVIPTVRRPLAVRRVGRAWAQ